MRRSILFNVMATKRKAAGVEENDLTDTWTEEEVSLLALYTHDNYMNKKKVSLLLQIATAYKNEKNKRRKGFGIDQITLRRYSEIIL